MALLIWFSNCDETLPIQGNPRQHFYHMWLHLGIYFGWPWVAIQRFMLWWVSDDKSFQYVGECCCFFVLCQSSIVPTDYLRTYIQCLPEVLKYFKWLQIYVCLKNIQREIHWSGFLNMLLLSSITAHEESWGNCLCSWQYWKGRPTMD